MKKSTTTLLIILLSLAASVQAAPANYWSVGGSLLTFDDGFNPVEPIQIFGRIGHDFNENIGIGFERGFSLVKDEVLGVDFDVTTTFLYLKGSLPIGDNEKLYAMIGPTNTELTGSLGGFSYSIDDDDTGIGFGFEKSFNSSSISVDYIIYNDNDGVDVSAINVGFVSYF